MPRIAVKMPVLDKKPPQMPKNAPNCAPKSIWGEFLKFGAEFGAKNVWETMVYSWDYFYLNKIV